MQYILFCSFLPSDMQTSGIVKEIESADILPKGQKGFVSIPGSLYNVQQHSIVVYQIIRKIPGSNLAKISFREHNSVVVSTSAWHVVTLSSKPKPGRRDINTPII